MKPTVKRVLTGLCVACTCGVFGLGAARATPPRGLTRVPIVGPVEFDEFDVMVNHPDYKSRAKTKGESDGYVVYLKIVPGGDTGWHSHPGLVYVIVKSGTVTLIHDDFTSVSYPAGVGFVEEPGDVHVAVNEGDTDLELIVPAAETCKTGTEFRYTIAGPSELRRNAAACSEAASKEVSSVTYEASGQRSSPISSQGVGPSANSFQFAAVASMGNSSPTMRHLRKYPRAA